MPYINFVNKVNDVTHSPVRCCANPLPNITVVFIRPRINACNLFF